MPDQPAKTIAPDRFVAGATMLFVGMRRCFRFEERAGIASLWHAFGPHLGSITYTIPGAAFGPCLAPADRGDEVSFDNAPAVEVSSLTDLPEGLSCIRNALRAWAVFPHAGRVSTLGARCAAAGQWLAVSGRQPADCAMQMVEPYGPAFVLGSGNGGCEALDTSGCEGGVSWGRSCPATDDPIQVPWRLALIFRVRVSQLCITPKDMILTPGAG